MEDIFKNYVEKLRDQPVPDFNEDILLHNIERRKKRKHFNSFVLTLIIVACFSTSLAFSKEMGKFISLIKKDYLCIRIDKSGSLEQSLVSKEVTNDIESEKIYHSYVTTINKIKSTLASNEFAVFLVKSAYENDKSYRVLKKPNYFYNYSDLKKATITKFQIASKVPSGYKYIKGEIEYANLNSNLNNSYSKIAERLYNGNKNQDVEYVMEKGKLSHKSKIIKICYENLKVHSSIIVNIYGPSTLFFEKLSNLEGIKYKGKNINYMKKDNYHSVYYYKSINDNLFYEISVLNNKGIHNEILEMISTFV